MRMKRDAKEVITELLNASGVEFTSLEHKELAGQTVYAVEAPQEQFPQASFYDVVHAFDHLSKKIVEQQNVGTDSEPVQFLFDINDFRSRQIRDLQARALMMADRARSFQYDVELTPMSAYERLIVHATLAGAPNIKTESQGEGRSRRVVIKYQA